MRLPNKQVTISKDDISANIMAVQEEEKKEIIYGDDGSFGLNRTTEFVVSAHDPIVAKIEGIDWLLSCGDVKYLILETRQKPKGGMAGADHTTLVCEQIGG